MVSVIIMESFAAYCIIHHRGVLGVCMGCTDGRVRWYNTSSNIWNEILNGGDNIVPLNGVDTTTDCGPIVSIHSCQTIINTSVSIWLYSTRPCVGDNDEKRIWSMMCVAMAWYIWHVCIIPQMNGCPLVGVIVDDAILLAKSRYEHQTEYIAFAANAFTPIGNTCNTLLPPIHCSFDIHACSSFITIRLCMSA